MAEAPPKMVEQYSDNLKWIQKADENKLVVGSKARILYADAIARSLIMLRFSEAVEKGQIKGPVTLSRDHHDVSGADSPYR
jgi:urocanate hydratase